MPNLELQNRAASQPFKTDWKVWEADLLVSSGLKKQLVTVFVPDSGDTLQTFIYGFDLEQSELLLDGLFPRPTWLSAVHRQGPRHFWIQIRCENGLYNLQVSPSEVMGGRGSELLSVKVLGAGLSSNRRWRPRVYFETRQGPEVELQLDYQPMVIGRVANLSNQGAMIEIYGKNLSNPVQNSRSLRGNYRFNDHFHLDLRGSIRQSRFLRSPCCHTQVRVQFSLMSAETRAQLDTFIHSASGLALDSVA